MKSDSVRSKNDSLIRHAYPGRKSFTVELMPGFTGTFTVNPAKVSLMYFPTVFSNEGLKDVRIY